MSVDQKTKISIPMAIVAAAILSVGGWFFAAISSNRSAITANQIAIVEALGELKYNRQMIESHCDADSIRSPADVRDSVRTSWQ
ncbi:MAG: hypothetical protein JW936_01235 [Sedimentisphaerales bacterium]|nr:hypothetical protein [Sedimentisphaerales bacterium]